MALNNFYKVGLVVVIMLLVAILGALSGCVTEVPETTTITPVTTQPTTTTPTTTTPQTTSTSTSTTTQPLAEYGNDVGSVVFKTSKRETNAGNFIDLRLSFYNSKRRTIRITELELYGVDIQKGDAGDDIWGVPDGDYILTPNKLFYPREKLEYNWIVQAPTGVVNETKFFFKAKIYYWGESTKYYVDAPELQIIVNP